MDKHVLIEKQRYSTDAEIVFGFWRIQKIMIITKRKQVMSEIQQTLTELETKIKKQIEELKKIDKQAESLRKEISDNLTHLEDTAKNLMSSLTGDR